MDNTQQQYPCMQMTIEQWEFAKPYLKMWKYEIVGFSINRLIDKTQSLIVLNYSKFGVITNLSIGRAQNPSRYLVTDLDIFLTQAAELKGYEYPKLIKNQTYTSYSELQGHKLQPGDTVKFTFKHQTYEYLIKNTYLYNYNLNIDNGIIFKVLNLNISEFCTAILGYTPKLILDTPFWKLNDFVGATNLCLALFQECDKQNSTGLPNTMQCSINSISYSKISIPEVNISRSLLDITIDAENKVISLLEKLGNSADSSTSINAVINEICTTMDDAENWRIRKKQIEQLKKMLNEEVEVEE